MTADHDPTESEDQTAPSLPASPEAPASAAEAAEPKKPIVVEEPQDAARPSDRIQIGTQREAEADAPALAPKPVNPGAANPDRVVEQKRKSYPPPNIRAQLPPELEQELQAALAVDPVDQLMESSADASSQAELAPETRVNATVVSIHGEDIFFDLGVGRSQGVAQLKQFETPPEVGAQMEMVVSKYDAEQGIYEIGRSAAAVSVGNWDEVHEGQVIDVLITGANKGGLECTVANIRGFMPMGQISMFRVENAEDYVGQRLTCVITEANRSRKNLVLSHRALMERERKENREKILAEIAPGQIREGTVRSLQEFGAFVDLGGVDGLIHVSQMSWDRIGHPSEVLQVGQAVKVRVEKVNPETGKISLVYRDMGANPWADVSSKYGIGSRVKGTVSKLMQFGAFVKLEPGVEGLIHISELGHGRVMRTSDVLSEGQEVETKVLAVDPDAQRISLSLKALLAAPEKPEHRRPEPEPEREPTPEELKRQEHRRKANESLKGGISAPSGGEKFGLKW